jgi:hypothetical protein
MGKDSKAQPEKFKHAARELGCEDDEEAFDRALATIARPIVHASDCEVHNEPAYPAGECTCGAKGER